MQSEHPVSAMCILLSLYLYASLYYYHHSSISLAFTSLTIFNLISVSISNDVIGTFITSESSCGLHLPASPYAGWLV